jgi:hypothetical protein
VPIKKIQSFVHPKPLMEIQKKLYGLRGVADGRSIPPRCDVLFKFILWYQKPQK